MVNSGFQLYTTHGFRMMAEKFQGLRVEELLFEKNYSYQGAWSAAVMQIAEYCVALRRMYLDLKEMVRPDHIKYI
jgi:hypothetical protein